MPTALPDAVVASIRKAGLGTYFRLRDVRPLGITLYELERAVARGEVERIARGLYRIASDAIEAEETIASIAVAVPRAIVCLLTALRLHEIGTQNPHEVWIALDRRRRRPANLPSRARIVRFSGPMLTAGIATMRLLGVPVLVTNPARTVVDCFRYRNKIGIDVAVEALRDFTRRFRGGANELARLARACRVARVMQPYLDSIP
jgi:predicted transcriptional regulator of viral defense system